MLGIIGGMGPAAGADLLRKIIENTKAGNDQEHLPVIMFSIPGRIKDRTAFLEGKTDVNPGEAIGDICLKMEKAGVTIIGIPCNTVFAPKIFNKIMEVLKKAKSHVKLIHLIDENIEFLEKKFNKKTRIAVLSTTGTYEQKIYFDKINAAGFKCIIPSEEMQRESIHSAIYHKFYGIKSTNNITDLARYKLYDVMNVFIEQRAQAIILGCTEIPLALTEDVYKGAILIDTTRILARAMIRSYDKSKLK